MLIIFVAINVVLMVLMLFARFELRTFLVKHHAIDSTEAMADFKQLARINMIGALVYLVLGFIVLVMAVRIGMSMGLTGLLGVICFSLPALWMGLRVKALEDQSKNLPCEPAFKEEYERIKEVWVKKALPDF